MAGKRQKLEVIRRPPPPPSTCKVEEDQTAEIDDLCIIPQIEDDEAADEKLDDEEEEDADDPYQKAAVSTPLVASPVYPNAVKWSDDNLIAVATSQLITILNPDMMDGPRGFVTASSGQSFVIGTVQHTDADDSCLLPFRLSKDVRAVVRCMDWSPQGLGPNGGCLLAVCTRDHRVKLYRAPHCEYQCEWIQIFDVSETLYGHHLTSSYNLVQQGDISLGMAGHGSEFDMVHESNQSNLEGGTSQIFPMVPSGSSVATGKRQKGVMDSRDFVRFTNVLAYISVAWSPSMQLESLSKDSLKITTLTMACIALGAKSGDVSVLKCIQPPTYSLEKETSTADFSLHKIFKAHDSWVSALAWSKRCKRMHCEHKNWRTCFEELLLVTGSSDGRVKLWGAEVSDFINTTPSADASLSLKKNVLEDHAPVTSVALAVLGRTIQIAVGKASGTIIVVQTPIEEGSEQEAFSVDAHSQAVTGLVWAFDGRCLYSCSQDNSLHVWGLNGGHLLALPFPEECSRKLKKSSLLPDSVLDGYFGLCISKGSLALATLRGVSTELLDQMYESRAVKATAQVFWVGCQQFDVAPLPCSLEQIHVVRICNLERSSMLWESNLLAALHCLENSSSKLVLWDITANLTYLASVLGKAYLNSFMSKWLSNQGLVYSDGEEYNCISAKGCKEGILNASCRRLQIAFAVLKRLYLAECHDPLTIMDKMSIKIAAESRFESLENKWQSFLLDVEHELRERLVHLTILVVLRRLRNCNAAFADDEFVESSGVSCMLQWVAANSSSVSLQLANDAKILVQALKVAKVEACGVCMAKVPFLSVDAGVCEGGHPHKLPRCLVTFKVCPPGSHWFCYCCARWASKQAPQTFFTSSSRCSLLNMDSNDLIWGVEPSCPYCGVLMQRYFPDCFLRMSLV